LGLEAWRGVWLDRGIAVADVGDTEVLEMGLLDTGSLRLTKEEKMVMSRLVISFIAYPFTAGCVCCTSEMEN
jgi:G3E family GTPase